MTSRLNWLWRLMPLGLILLILGFHVSTNFALATEQPSPGWSRAIVLGDTNFDGSTLPVSLPDGSTMVINTTETGLQYFRLGSGGQPMGQGVLGLGTRDFASLTALGGKQVDLFWSSAADGRGTISRAAVTPEGSVSVPGAAIFEDADGYVARQTPAGPVVLAARKGTLTLLRQTGGEFGKAWEAPLPAAQLQYIDAQVLHDGAVLVVVGMEYAKTDARIYLLRGTVDGGITATVELEKLALKQDPGLNVETLGPVRLGVDTTNGYVIYTISAMKRSGMRETSLFMVTGPLAGQWQTKPLNFAGALNDKISAFGLTNPAIAPGQGEALKVAFLTNTSSRFEGNQGLVMGTFRQGQLEQVELLSHTRAAVRPVALQMKEASLVAFESPVGISKRRVVAVSSAPAAIQRMSRATSQDLLNAIMNTMFDMTTIIYPIMSSGLWWVPMICLVGLLHLVALNWSERNPRLMFWVGVAVALPMMAYVGLTRFTGDNYTHAMPAWLATPYVQGGLYVAVALFFLALVLRLKPPSRYVGALVPLGWWAAGTILTMSLILGPFVRRG